MQKKYSCVDIVFFYTEDIVSTSVETGFIPFFKSPTEITFSSSVPNCLAYDVPENQYEPAYPFPTE